MNRKYDNLVSFPSDKTSLTAFIDACQHNNKLGNLLEYFHYNATIEATKQGLTIGVEEITISRTLDNIISGLNKKGIEVSKKTVIDWIVKLQSLNYILADGYRHKYTLNLKNIQAGIDTPPPVKNVKLRGIHASRAAIEATSEDSEDCNFTIHPKTTIQDGKIVNLQSRIVDLQSQIVKLQSWIVDLQSSESRQAASIAALEGKIESLLTITYYNTNTTTNVGMPTVPAAASIPPNIPEEKSKTPSKKPVRQKESKPYFDSIHENNFWRLWLACWINKHKDLAAPNETAKKHVNVLAPLIQTEEALNRLIDISAAEMKAKKFKGLPELGNLRRSLAEWEQENKLDGSYSQIEDAPDLEEDENREILFCEERIKGAEAYNFWYLYRWMTVKEARNYGYGETRSELVNQTRNEVANLLSLQPEEAARLAAEYRNRALIPA